jgi:hypothetical protein
MVSIYIMVVAVLIFVLPLCVLAQFKAGLFWRLISTAFMVFAAGWICYQFARVRGIVILGGYNRDSHEIVDMVDQLAVEGRTNDVHEICQKYSDVFVLELSDLTNLDTVFRDAANRVSSQPNTALEPTPTAP